MSENEDRGLLESAKEILRALFHSDTQLSLYGRVWSTKDRKALMEYDALSEAAVGYIFADEKQRNTIESGLEEIFYIRDAKAAIEYFLCTKVNSPFEAEKLFRRIGLNTGFFIEFAKHDPRVKSNIIEMMHDALEGVVLAIHAPDTKMSLNSCTLLLRAYMECTLAQVRNNGINDPQTIVLTIPSFAELSRIFRENEFEVDDYVSFGNEKLDSIAKEIYGAFRKEIEKDALVSFVEKNKKSGQFLPYSSWDYTSALTAIQQMDRHLENGDLEAYIFEPSRMKDFKETTGELRSLTKEVLEFVEDGPPKHTQTILKLSAKMMLRDFFMYLTASDGFYSGKKAKAVSEAIEEEMSPDDIREYVEKHDIYTVSFEQKEPLFLNFIMQIDDGLREKGLAQAAGYSRRFVDLMEKAGEQFLKIDGSMNDEEEQALVTYVSMLRDYLDKNREEETS